MVRGFVAALALALVSAPAFSGSLDEKEARRAAEVFGRALVASDTSSLRAVLPTQGKVRMRLAGPRRGGVVQRQPGGGAAA